MRFLGAALVTAAGLWGGVFAAGQMKRRAQDVRSLCRLLELMLYEIERFCTPLPDLFSSLAERTEGPARELARAISASLATGEERFSDAWRRVCGGISAEEREVLLPLGPILGAYGAAEQVSALSAVLSDMRRLEEERRRAASEKSRLWIGLMTAGSLLAAVLLW